MSPRTLKPCETPEYRVIWYGWPVLMRISSDLWRFSVVKIPSVSAAAIDRGPVMAASSSSSTNDGWAKKPAVMPFL